MWFPVPSTSWLITTHPLPVFLFFFFSECEHVVFQHCQKRELQKLMLVVLFKKLRLSIIWNQYLIINLADFHVYLILFFQRNVPNYGSNTRNLLWRLFLQVKTKELTMQIQTSVFFLLGRLCNVYLWITAYVNLFTSTLCGVCMAIYRILFFKINYWFMVT